MSNDFLSARHWARELHENTVREGSIVIDATMGNGHDTLWLCRRVGSTGRVYAFDIQQSGIDNTRARLKEAGIESRAELICAGHENMATYVRSAVDAVIFNLGWLPGGEKSVTTRAETTLMAADAARSLLVPGGLMTICVYPGHAEGVRERDALIPWASALNPARFDVMLRQYLNQPNDPPLLIALRRRL